MMGIDFIQDLAIVIIAAAFAGFLCRKLGLSPVVGYLLAGVAIGPHTPPFSFISDQERIQTLSQLGLIFLMFSIGIGFSLRRLKQLGFPLLAGTFATALLVLFFGRTAANVLGWNPLQGLFLAGILMCSSSAVIGKVLRETGGTHERSGQLALGITLSEDAVAVVMITILGSYTQFGGGSVGVSDVVSTIAIMVGFILLLLTAGLLLLPRLLDAIGRLRIPELETLIIAGLLLGLALVAFRAGYSLVLGAFLLGAVVSETIHGQKVERSFSGMRDVFSTVFFVAIGMSVDVTLIPDAIWLIIGITLLALIVRVVAATLALLLVGEHPRHAVRSGLTVTPLGEFSFIIAQIGVSAAVVPPEFQVLAVGASLITCLIAPLLIRHSRGIANALGSLHWDRFATLLQLYHELLATLHRQRSSSQLWRLSKKRLLQIGIEMLLITAILVFSTSIHDRIASRVLATGRVEETVFTFVYWSALLVVLAIPFIALWRNTAALAMIVADYLQLSVPALRPISQTVTFAMQSFAAVILLIWIWNVLPFSFERQWMLLGLAIFIGLAVSLYWRHFIRFHSQLEYSLETILSEGGRIDEHARKHWKDQQDLWSMEISEVALPDAFAHAGISIADAALRPRFGVTVALIERQGHFIRPASPTNHLFPNDRLLLFGTRESIAEAKQFLLQDESEAPQSNDISDLGMEVLEVPSGSTCIGRSLRELNLTRLYGVQILGIEHDQARNLQPSPDDRLQAGDRLLVLALPAQIRAVQDRFDRLVSA